MTRDTLSSAAAQKRAAELRTHRIAFGILILVTAHFGWITWAE